MLLTLAHPDRSTVWRTWDFTAISALSVIAWDSWDVIWWGYLGCNLRQCNEFQHSKLYLFSGDTNYALFGQKFEFYQPWIDINVINSNSQPDRLFGGILWLIYASSFYCSRLTILYCKDWTNYKSVDHFWELVRSIVIKNT